MSRSKYYSGPPVEFGGTSISGTVSKFMLDLYSSGIFYNKIVLDYGAGKYARNADFLRSLGIEVYAFDPYNSSKTGSDGWLSGSVSNMIPRGVKFDIAYTSYVLNVVPKYTENEIVKNIEKISKYTIHIVRDDIIYGYNQLVRSFKSGNKNTLDFFYDKFATEKEIHDLETVGYLSDKTIRNFGIFGFATSRGFQRHTELDGLNYKLSHLSNKGKYRIYMK